MEHLYSFVSIFIPFFLFLMAISFLLRALHFRNIIFSIFCIFAAYLQFNLNLISSGLYKTFPYTLFTHLPFGASLGPLLYLFIKNITENKQKFFKKDYLHFIIPFLAIFMALRQFILPIEEKIAIIDKFMSGQKPFFAYISLSFMSLFIFYAVLSLHKVWKNFKKDNTYHKKISIFLITILSWISVVFIKVYAVFSLSDRIFEISNFVLFANLIFLFLVIQKHPNLFLYGTISSPPKSQKSSHLEKIDIENINNLLKGLMEEEKFYCDEDLKLGRLSEALEISPHQLSEFLNSVYGKNFNQYVNEYRISESEKLLLENPRRNTLSIAYAVGFNSYSAYFSVFKNMKGLSPAEYRKKHLR